MHNHNDRGTLHSDCPACEVLGQMMEEAGFSAAPVPVISGNTPAQPRSSSWPELQKVTRGPIFTAGYPDISFTPDHFGTPTPDNVRAARLALLEMAREGGKVSTVAMGYHLLTEHAGMTSSHAVRIRLDLDKMQRLHGIMHELCIGHRDSQLGEHLVGPVDLRRVTQLVRADDQRRYSDIRKRVRAQEHERRTKAAQAQREQVITDSARALQRATAHAMGTIVPRVEMYGSGGADIKIGQRRPLTIATVTWRDIVAVGTAQCRAGDRWDSVIGMNLAIGRAFASLGALQTEYWLSRERQR